VRVPRARAHAERWVASLRRECLDRLLIFNRRQLERVVHVYAMHDRGRDRPCGRPPRRSQRALLTHWAPDLGAGVESLVGPGMRDAGGRQPSLRVAAHPLPGEAVSLAAAPERPVPEPHDLVAEGL